MRRLSGASHERSVCSHFSACLALAGLHNEGLTFLNDNTLGPSFSANYHLVDQQLPVLMLKSPGASMTCLYLATFSAVLNVGLGFTMTLSRSHPGPISNRSPIDK